MLLWEQKKGRFWHGQARHPGSNNKLLPVSLGICLRGNLTFVQKKVVQHLSIIYLFFVLLVSPDSQVLGPSDQCFKYNEKIQ